MLVDQSRKIEEDKSNQNYFLIKKISLKLIEQSRITYETVLVLYNFKCTLEEY